MCPTQRDTSDHKHVSFEEITQDLVESILNIKTRRPVYILLTISMYAVELLNRYLRQRLNTTGQKGGWQVKRTQSRAERKGKEKGFPQAKDETNTVFSYPVWKMKPWHIKTYCWERKKDNFWELFHSIWQQKDQYLLSLAIAFLKKTKTKKVDARFISHPVLC